MNIRSAGSTQESKTQQRNQWNTTRNKRRQQNLAENRQTQQNPNQMEQDPDGYTASEYANMFTQQTQTTQQQPQQKKKYFHSPFSRNYNYGKPSKWKPSRSYKKWRRRKLKKRPQTMGWEVTKKRYNAEMKADKAFHKTRNKALERVTYNTFTIQTPAFILDNNVVQSQVNSLNPLYDASDPTRPDNPMFIPHTIEVVSPGYYPIDLVTNNIIGDFMAEATELVSVDVALDIMALTPGISLTDFTIRLAYLPNPRDIEDEELEDDLLMNTISDPNLNDPEVYSEQYEILKKRVNAYCTTFNSAQYTDKVLKNNIINHQSAINAWARKLPLAFPVSMYSQLDNKTLTIKKYHTQAFPSNGMIHKKLSYKPPAQRTLVLKSGWSLYAIVSFIHTGIHGENKMAISSRTTVGFVQY